MNRIETVFEPSNISFCEKCPLHVDVVDPFDNTGQNRVCKRFCLQLVQIRLVAGQVLDLSNRPHTSLYIVRKGAMKTQINLSDGRSQVLNFRFPGDLLCGAVSLQNEESTLEALTDTVLLEAPKNIFEPECDSKEKVGCHGSLWSVLNVLTGIQMERLVVHNLMLGQLTAKERIIAFLLELALRTGRFLTDRYEFALPMSREDIAHYLGLNELTVIRTLSRLRKDGMIDMPDPSHVYISDLEQLSHLTSVGPAILTRLKHAFPDHLPQWRKEQAVVSSGFCPFSEQK